MGKRAANEYFEADTLPVKKASRCEKGMAETEARNIIVSRLKHTPIGKWSDHEYSLLQQTNIYVKPNANNCSTEF
jgi:hypothetical protein